MLLILTLIQAAVKQLTEIITRVKIKALIKKGGFYMTGIIGNDKAIEFQSTLLKIKMMLNSLESIGLDISPYEEILEKIEQASKNIKMSGDDTTLFSSDIAGMDYAKLTAKLQELESRLKEYEIYFKSSNYVDSISLVANYTVEELKIIAKTVISLLNSINYSKTRIYKTEKNVVEKLYSFAYKIIKLELSRSGSSQVLDWCKNDTIAANFINHEVEKDLAKLSKEELNNPMLKECIAREKAKGLAFSYLDETLILNLTIQNSDELLDEIKEALTNIAHTLEENEYSLNRNEKKLKGLNKDIKEEKVAFKKAVVADSLKCVATLSLIAGMLFGTYKFAKFITKVEYLDTKSEVFSTSQVVQTPTKEGYLPKIDSSDAEVVDETITTTKIIEYGPWEKTFFNDGYSREVATFDVSGINYSNLEDYLSLDLKTLGYEAEETEETKETLSPEDLYDELIREVERTTQNLDDVEIKHDGFIFILTASEVLALAILLFIELILDDSYYDSLLDNLALHIKLKDYKEERKDFQILLEKSKELLEENKKRILENETLRARFVELYTKYAPFINDSSLDKTYQKLTRKKD